MRQRKSPRICQNCGKPITGKESASIFISGEKLSKIVN